MQERIVNVVLSGALRCVFLGLSRTYVKQVLLADLQEVIREEDLPSGLASPGEMSDTPLSPVRLNDRLSPRPQPTRQLSFNTQRRSKLYTRLSTLVFCLAFSESCVLCTIVVVGNLVNERLVLFLNCFAGKNLCCRSKRTRWANWTTSIGVLLAIIFVAAPLGQCWTLTTRGQSERVYSRSIWNALADNAL